LALRTLTFDRDRQDFHDPRRKPDANGNDITVERMADLEKPLPRLTRGALAVLEKPGPSAADVRE
jgi:hypothetical protein